MKITDLSIKYRTVIVVFTLLITVGGLFTYVTIPKESSPSLDIPYVIVTTPYPGASPQDVENIVTQELEREIQDINGIEEIRSTSTEGVSSIVVEFQPSVETTEAYRNVQDEVTTARSDLPDGAEDPMVNEINSTDFPILNVNMQADYSLARLKETAEDLQDEIEGIGNVLQANLTGGLEREVQVNVNLASLKGYGLTFTDLVNTIESENTSIPGGDVDVDRQNYLVRIDGRFRNPERIEDLVLTSTEEGRNVYVRDVADVIFGFKDRQTYSRLRVLRKETAEDELVNLSGEAADMHQVVSLSVEKRSGANIIETVQAVKQEVRQFDLPSGTKVIYTGDQSEQVDTMVTDLQNNIISGLIFVVLVLLFFMGARNATLVGIAIPLSMFTTFLVFEAMGQTLNFVILFSLIIALGMLVDNAIVIVENIYRFREEGYGRFEAARLGAAEVGPAIIASTATTVGAFAPMLFWPGIVGQFMSYMPLTLIITLTCSLFVAVVINPVITGIFMKLEDEDTTHRSSKGDSRVKYWSIGATAVAGLALGLMNWQTLVVVTVAAPVLYLMYRWLLKPLGAWFMADGLPQILEAYRGFLGKMLERDYSVRRGLLRNAGALSLLVLGVILGVLGGAIAAVAGQTAGMVFLVPAGIIGGLGVLGIIVHAFESAYAGGFISLKIGTWLGMFTGLAVVLMHLTGNSLDAAVIGSLFAIPGALVVLGGLGSLLNSRDYLILTDNRSRVLNGVIALLIVIGGLYSLAPTGVQFFPETDPAQMQITIDAPLGTNVEATNRIAGTAMDRLRDLIRDNPVAEANIKNMLVSVGTGGSSALGGGGDTRPHRLQITVNFVDYAVRPEATTQTIERIRRRMQGIPGTDVEITKQQTGPSTGPPVNIEISGPEFDRIVEISTELKRILGESDIPGLVDVTDDLNMGRPEVRVDVNRVRAGQFGLSTQQIASTVRAAIAGTQAGEYRDGEDEYDITVRLREQDRESIESLNDLTIPRGSEQIPITAVANLVEGSGFGSITRVDVERVVTVSGDAGPGYTGPQVVQSVQESIDNFRQNLPPGYTLSFTGGNEQQQESFNFLGTALAVGIALILMVLIAEFNSVLAPFIIMTAVGLSLIGVLLGLMLTRTPFSLFTFIGVISLAGIVVNNNIVLVDYIMQLRNRGVGKYEAIIEGGATRLRPVLLTALTTMLGLVPLTFGINVDFVGLLSDFDPNFQLGSSNTQFWGPMGTAIIAGLLFGTILTLLIVPVMYSVFDSLNMRFTGYFGGDTEEAGIVSDAVSTDGLSGPNGNGRSKPETPSGRKAEVLDAHSS